MQKGYFMEALMDFSVAIMLEKAKPKDPNDINKVGQKKEKSILHLYYCGAGQAHYELAQFQEALVHFDTAIADEANGNNYLNRGLTYMKLNNFTKAETDLNKALTMYMNAKKGEGESGSG